MKGPTTIPPVPNILAADEMEVIRLYRIMDHSEKSHYQEAMKWSAEKFPALPAPRLYLVTGGQP